MAANSDGDLKAAGFVAGGSAPVGTTGSCPGVTGLRTGTIILSALMTVPKGYSGNAQDQTADRHAAANSELPNQRDFQGDPRPPAIRSSIHCTGF
jgi:hypothetical protein